MHLGQGSGARAAWCLCGLLALTARVDGGTGAEAVALTRAKVLRAVRERLRFSGELAALPEAEREQVLAALGLDALAAEILPDSIPVRSEADAKVILGGIRPVVKTRDAAYNRLAMKKLLMDIRIDAQMNTALPVLSAAEREQLVAEADKLAHGAQESMLKHLGGTIPEAELLRCVKEFRDGLVQQIDYPKTYAMKQTLGAEAVEHLLRVFDGRLALTAHRAAERLAALPAQPGDKAAEARRAAETRRILMEVLHPLRRETFNRTSPERLRTMDADDILPGYAKVVQDLHNLEFQRARQARVRRPAQDGPAARPTLRSEVYDEKLVEEAMKGLSDASRAPTSRRAPGGAVDRPVAPPPAQEPPQPARSEATRWWPPAVMTLLPLGAVALGLLVARRRRASTSR